MWRKTDTSRDANSITLCDVQVYDSLDMQMCLMMSLPPVLAIPYQSAWPKPSHIRGFVGKGTVNNNVIKGYSDSENLCKDFFQPWWSEYSPRRALLLSKGHLRNLMSEIADKLPAIPVYDRSPVQSLEAKLGHRRHNPRGVYTDLGATRICQFACEDIRTDLEVYLTSIFSGKKQVRQKTGYHMKCPDLSLPVIEHVPDDREPTTPELEELDKILIANPIYNIAYVGKWTYPLAIPRVVGMPITRCVCKPVAKLEADGLIDDATRDRMRANLAMYPWSWEGDKGDVKSEDAEGNMNAESDNSKEDEATLDAESSMTNAEEPKLEVERNSEDEETSMIHDMLDTGSLITLSAILDMPDDVQDHPFREPSTELESAVLMWLDSGRTL